eukprot:gene14842-20896_t
MAPNSTVKGGLSHSAQKKENAASKKDVAKKGTAGKAKAVATKQMCSICRIVSQNMSEIKKHFDARHDKPPMPFPSHKMALL